MDQSGKFHFTDHVVVIVAGATIAAKSDIDTTGKHLWDLAHARGKLTIGGGIVRNMGTCSRQFINVFRGEPDHVYQHRSRAKQTDAFSVIDG